MGNNDQPLFLLLKIIQLCFPGTHGEHKLFGVMNILHIEERLPHEQARNRLNMALELRVS